MSYETEQSQSFECLTNACTGRAIYYGGQEQGLIGCWMKRFKKPTNKYPLKTFTINLLAAVTVLHLSEKRYGK